MKYRKLGKTGLEVAEVGMGTWQLADDPNVWVGADMHESLSALYRYTELGGNFVDTAWMYGYDDKNPDWHPSEELIGKFIAERGRRGDLIIATKIAPKNFQWPAFQNVDLSEVFPSEWIQKSVNDSLKSLNVDYLDLMQFHVWNDDFHNRDEWKQTIERITKDGKVKYWGISVNDYQPSNCLKTLDTGLIDTVQCIYNIFHQMPERKLFPYARENKIGIIARVPLDEGGLTGKITKESRFPIGDFRNTYFQGERLTELVQKTDSLKDLLGKEALTLPELSLRFVLSQDEVSTVIPGMKKVEYVDQNASVSDGVGLSDGLLYELKKHAWERNFYDWHDPALVGSGFIEPEE